MGCSAYLALWAFAADGIFHLLAQYHLDLCTAFAARIRNPCRRAAQSLAARTETAAVAADWPRSTSSRRSLLLMHATLYYFDHYDLVKPSQKDPAQWYLHVRPNADSELFTYRRRYYSAEFYSAGKAKMIEPQALSTLFDNGTTDFLIIQSDDLQRIAPELRARLHPLQAFGEFDLLEEIAPQNAAP